MRAHKKGIILTNVFSALMFFGADVFAYETVVEAPANDEEMIAIYGTACERIRPEEQKSSARVRVTDKASFLGVSDVLDLVDFKGKLNEHDFNVMVYNIVDNLIEDMAVRTIRQDQGNICVEITGFIDRENMYQAVEGALSSTAPSKAPVAEAKAEEPVKPKEPELIVDGFDDKVFLYVAPVEFYNNTKSAQYAELLKEQFGKSPDLKIIDNENAAKYVLVPKVLRAKVEAINSENSRLQMVVAIELKNPASKFSVSEHQNKFVLFTKSDDEQKVASDLMKKLFEKAGETILKKLSSLEEKAGSGKNGNMPSVITPNGG